MNGKKPLRTLLVGLLLGAQACVTISEHPWNARPPLPPTRHSSWSGIAMHPGEVLDHWAEVPQSQIALVKYEELDEASQMLIEQPFISLDDEMVRRLAENELPTLPTLNAYLVRGLSYRHPPDWVRVFLQKKTNELWVQQSFWNEVDITPRLGNIISESPVIVLLKSSPARIFVTGHYSGDSSLGADPRGLNSKTTAFWLVECDYPLRLSLMGTNATILHGQVGDEP